MRSLSLLYLETPTTFPYPEPDVSIPELLTHFLQDSFIIIFSHTSRLNYIHLFDVLIVPVYSWYYEISVGGS
jgi:hypothetical protein